MFTDTKLAKNLLVIRYLSPARFYVTHFDAVAVEHVRRPTPAGEGRRCLLVFNDIIFVCKAIPGMRVNKSEQKRKKKKSTYFMSIPNGIASGRISGLNE